jgi:hypothetical protein
MRRTSLNQRKCPEAGHKVATSRPRKVLCFNRTWRAGLTDGTALKEGVRECLNLYRPPESCFAPA